MTYWESVVFVLQGLAYAVAFFAVVVTILMVCAVIGTLWDNWPRFTALLGLLLLIFGLPFLISRMTAEPETTPFPPRDESVTGYLIHEDEDSCRYRFIDSRTSSHVVDILKAWAEDECQPVRTWHSVSAVLPVGD